MYLVEVAGADFFRLPASYARTDLVRISLRIHPR